MKSANYLLTLLRDQRICIDRFAHSEQLSSPFPMDALAEQLQALPLGYWLVLDDLTDPRIECVHLPNVHSREARAALAQHCERLFPDTPWRHTARLKGQPGHWLLQALGDTPEQSRSRALGLLAEKGHHLVQLVTCAHVLCQPISPPKSFARWLPTHRTAPALQLEILPDSRDMLLVLSQAGQLRFARTLQENSPDRAVQAILPTLHANQILPHSRPITPHTLPPTEARSTLRHRVLHGQLPAVKFLPTSSRWRPLWVWLPLVVLLGGISYAALRPSAPSEEIPVVVPSSPPVARFPILLAALHQARVRLDRPLSRLECLWQGQTFQTQGFDETGETVPVNMGTDAPAVAAPDHWHTPDRLAWIQRFHQQQRWPEWKFQLTPADDAFTLEFSSRHDAQAFRRLQVLTNSVPDELEPQRCTFTLQDARLHTQCQGRWRARTDFPEQPTTPPMPLIHDWPPVFWDLNERRILDAIAAEEASRGGWLLRSDGLQLRWAHGAPHGSD